jgi:hypothetical protein
MAALVISMGVLAYGYGQFSCCNHYQSSLIGYRLRVHWNYHYTRELQARLRASCFPENKGGNQRSYQQHHIHLYVYGCFHFYNMICKA